MLAAAEGSLPAATPAAPLATDGAKYAAPLPEMEKAAESVPD